MEMPNDFIRNNIIAIGIKEAMISHLLQRVTSIFFYYKIALLLCLQQFYNVRILHSYILELD